MKLAEFAKWIIENSSFEGIGLDGGAVQDKAEELGVLTKTKYDPTIHGETDICETGDDWFVFSNEFEAALSANAN